jgi:hypothetical protein
MTFPGTVVNGVVVLDAPQSLPEGTRVEVQVRAPPSPPAASGTAALGNLSRVPNRGMLGVLAQIGKTKQPLRETDGTDTLKFLRQARDGGMYGDKPAE